MGRVVQPVIPAPWEVLAREEQFQGLGSTASTRLVVNKNEKVLPTRQAVGYNEIRDIASSTHPGALPGTSPVSSQILPSKSCLSIWSFIQFSYTTNLLSPQSTTAIYLQLCTIVHGRACGRTTPPRLLQAGTIPRQPEGWSLPASFPLLQHARVTPNAFYGQSGVTNSPFCWY